MSLDFSIAEYRERLERTQRDLAAHQLDGLLLHGPENIAYLSGFHLSIGSFAYHALLVPARGDPVLIVRALEEPLAAASSWVERWSSYADSEEPAAATARAAAVLGLQSGRVGVEHHSWFLTLDRYERLCALLPHVTFVAEPRIVDHLRLRKSSVEAEYIRAACRVVEAGMRAGLAALSPGVSERELAAEITAARIRAGSDVPLLGVVASGPRTDLLHGPWTDRLIERGDAVRLEFSGVVRGYWGRLMRTGVAGRPSPEQEGIADVVIGALEDGIARMRPGASAREVGDACRSPILRASLRETYENRVGYSLGLNHLPTSGEFLREMTPNADWQLEAGMVFHMLLIARGIGFSEMVLVTEAGHEVLTRHERALAPGP